MWAITRSGFWLVLLLVAAAAGCGGGDEVGAPSGDVAAIEVTSDDLTAGGTVPTEFTCDGADRAPSLSWTGVPSEAQELVIVVDDPDAPGGTFTHWIAWGIDPGTATLGGTVPAGAVEGTNGFGDTGYGGPCPPEGDDPHTYRFRVLALDSAIDLDAGASAGELGDAVEGHVIGEGELTATYGR